MPSGFSLPVEAIPRAEAAHHLLVEQREQRAAQRSKTTSRSEFEPRSMTPMRPVLRLEIAAPASDQRTTSLGWPRLSALPRPDRLGFVMK